MKELHLLISRKTNVNDEILMVDGELLSYSLIILKEKLKNKMDGAKFLTDHIFYDYII